jgi:hypothetical protein
MVTESAIQLPIKVWQRIVQLGVERHVQELEAQLEEAQQQIAGFERKFGMSFVDLEQEGLPEDADWQVHEDWVEWSSWEGLKTDLEQQLANFRAMPEPTDA